MELDAINEETHSPDPVVRQRALEFQSDANNIYNEVASQLREQGTLGIQDLYDLEAECTEALNMLRETHHRLQARNPAARLGAEHMQNEVNNHYNAVHQEYNRVLTNLRNFATRIRAAQREAEVAALDRNSGQRRVRTDDFDYRPRRRQRVDDDDHAFGAAGEFDTYDDDMLEDELAYALNNLEDVRSNPEQRYFRAIERRNLDYITSIRLELARRQCKDIDSQIEHILRITIPSINAQILALPANNEQADRLRRMLVDEWDRYDRLKDLKRACVAGATKEQLETFQIYQELPFANDDL